MTMEIVIVTPSDALQQGLVALLGTLPAVTSIQALKDVAAACTYIEQHKPIIVLLELAMLGQNPEGVLDQIKSLSVNTKRVLLVEQPMDTRWLPQHAEAFLIQGTSPATVADLLTALAAQKGKNI